MNNLNKELIHKNILMLLHYSGLTDINFANLLGISDKQIKRIRKKDAEFSINDINKAADFFKKSISAINSTDIKLDRLFRDKLIVQHNGNAEYSKILEDRPTITYAINFELLQNEKFNSEGLTAGEIKEIFSARGWNYTSSYISLAMKRNENKISILPHPEIPRTNLYSKKQ